MGRSLNPDGTPWWVSTGPPSQSVPQPAAEPAVSAKREQELEPEIPSTDTSSNTSESVSSHPFEAVTDVLGSLGVTPAAQAAAINSGLNLLTGVMNLVSTPLNGKEETSVHVVATCGVCPLCVGVAALREHDEGLADLVESALAGVTSSVEKVRALVPDVMDNISEAFVEAIVRTVLHKSRN
ncbi:MAG: hypothetical protein RIS75_754 [Actinomycetota bacterium]